MPMLSLLALLAGLLATSKASECLPMLGIPISARGPAAGVEAQVGGASGQVLAPLDSVLREGKDLT